MKAFTNFGKTEEFKPIIKLGEKRYLVSFDKHDDTKEETVIKNSKPVGTGKMVPTGDSVWKSVVINGEPGKEAIKETLFNIINGEVSNAILNSFAWKGYKVYLSQQNQMNYKNAFDIAVATDGESLPVTFRFSRLGKTEYYTFDTLDELKKFYIDMNKHITNCLSNGWKRKDSINADDYII